MPTAKTIEETLADKVDFTGFCWLWNGSVNNQGRPSIHRSVNGKTQSKLAYRVTYEYLVGPIPENMTLDHLCRIPICVNPDHLEVVTMAENLKRAVQYLPDRKRQLCRFGHPIYQSRTKRYCKTCSNAKQTKRRNER